MNEATRFRILIVDDNPGIHRDFIKILKTDTASTLDKLSEGLFGEKKSNDALPQFEIDLASQGKEGADRVQTAVSEGRPYSLAFVDIRMPPGWDGIETIKHIWAIDKNIQIVICTAYSDYSWQETVAHLGKTDNLLIIKKPFDNVSVRQLACALTMKWKLAEEVRKNTGRLQQQVADRTLSLQESLSLVKSTFESSSDGILVVNLKGEVIDYNQKFISMLEVPQEILNSKSEEKILDCLRSKLIKPDDFFSKIKTLHTQLGKTSTTDIKFINGKIFECYSQPHLLNNEIIGRILDFRDITQRANLEAALQHQATHDELTQLPNRVKLLEQIKAAIKRADENKLSFALLFLDLDRFKLINDSLSHLSGDKVLKLAAARLQTMIRAEDTLARLGGDEFVIIIANIQKGEDLQSKIHRLLSVFQEPFTIEERHVTLSASIGVSFYPKDATTVDLLLRNSDAAMYHAKTFKGNNFQYYSPEMNEKNLALLDQEAELRHAISHNEFFLCYQPQVDLTTNKIVAVEALIRWNHPKKGVILPLDFIPLAEETGLIVPIGEWVIRTGCQQNKAWQNAGLSPIRISVNVTTQQFKQIDLVERIEGILKETGLKPEYLELELTENAIITNSETIEIITTLKKSGICIAVDDFGTGYSSLSYLRKIPLDRLKIDSSFIKNIHSGADDEVIVRAIIAMAKGLNLEVIAEGVETLDQLNFLKKYNCGDAQGFYFDKPLEAKDLEKILNTN